MDGLPAFWTAPIGVIAGYLYVGRVARWLQYVLATMGRPAGRFGVEPQPSTGKTWFAVVVYPTPWIAVGLAGWAIYHAVTAPLTNEWRWFYAGFFGGPIVTIWWIHQKVKSIRRKKKEEQSRASTPLFDDCLKSNDPIVIATATQNLKEIDRTTQERNGE